jgi:hypothetical protein
MPVEPTGIQPGELASLLILAAFVIAMWIAVADLP